MVQIRNVPEPIHRKLKARAAAAGMSLSEYLLAEVSARAAEPTPEEMRARLARRRPVAPRESSAAAVRAERAAR